MGKAEGKDMWEKLRSDFFVKMKDYSPHYLKIVPQAIINKLRENKPVCGAIVFNTNESKILVIKVGNKFGFPKGKCNERESAE